MCAVTSLSLPIHTAHCHNPYAASINKSTDARRIHVLLTCIVPREREESKPRQGIRKSRHKLPKKEFGAAVPGYAFANSDFEEARDGAAWTDNQLMQAVAASDEKAFAILMRRHAPIMVALARRITLNASDADEVVQEAFLRVWTNAQRWDADGPATFHTWARRIVTNLAIDRSRRAKPLPLEAAGDPADPLVDIAGTAERNDEARFVRDALERLPARQRAAVALCYFEEKSGAQAADIMGLTVGAVEALLVRAKRGLRQILDLGGTTTPEGK
jgi:RNA polymerase sigma-70 factor (ECF subfamily)